MNILSLFDGISCAQIALNRIGVKIDNYFASEVDKYAIQITMKNYPNTIQLGRVENVFAKDLPNIDLIVGGFPCQSFSVAGRRENFSDKRGMLFYECVRLLKECNPKYFLFENVVMKKLWQDEISKYFGVEPIMINSALVSAQNRRRLYWTNIPNIEQPQDRHILLADVIESGLVDRDKSHCIDANYFKGGSLNNYLEKSRRQIVLSQSEKRLCVLVERRTEKAKAERRNNYLQFGIDSCQRQDKEWIPRIDNKTNALLTSDDSNYLIDNFVVRKLTPLECERLQTIPEGYTKDVSNTQRYKMIGNGFTVDVIAHILSYMDGKHG